MVKDGELLAFCLFSEDEFERFAILPNIHNQKYTIGREFLGRNVQGEFIYSERLLPFDRENYCEILCENGTFWVTPLNDCPTFINEQQVKGKTELKFHTYLTLGKKYVENNGIEKNRRPNGWQSLDFLFRERKFKTPIASSNLNLNPPTDFVRGRNNLILSTILSLLPHSDLKAVREVSSFWNNEAARILKKNSVVKFNRENIASCFLRYENEMKDMKISRWELNLSDFDEFRYSSKLIEDLDWFLKSQDSLHELKLNLKYIYFDWFQGLTIILGKLCNFIKELELSDPYDSPKLDTFNQKYDLKFPNLTCIKFSEKFGNGRIYPEAEEVKVKLLSYFIKSSPSLTTIIIGKQSYSKSEGELFNLCSISIGFCNPIILAPLLDFEKPLTKFWLEDLDEFLSKDFRILEQLLEKNSQSLKSLKLGFSDFEGRSGVNSIQLPKLPKLHYLNIGIKFSNGTRDYDFIFPGGSKVNYKVYFPVLRHLVLAAIPSNKQRYAFENDNVLFPFLHDGALEVKTVEITCEPRFLRNSKKLSEPLVK